MSVGLTAVLTFIMGGLLGVALGWFIGVNEYCVHCGKCKDRLLKLKEKQ